MKKMTLYLAIGMGGMIGSCLRYIISILFENNDDAAFPWATLIVNCSGAFLLSFILFLPITKQKVNPVILSSITTGIIGSYTTFSALSVEVVALFQENIVKALCYLLITITGGLLGSFLGFTSARRFTEEVKPS